jgi:hypothetical protein
MSTMIIEGRRHLDKKSETSYKEADTSRQLNVSVCATSLQEQPYVPLGLSPTHCSCALCRCSLRPSSAAASAAARLARRRLLRPASAALLHRSSASPAHDCTAHRRLHTAISPARRALCARTCSARAWNAAAMLRCRHRRTARATRARNRRVRRASPRHARKAGERCVWGDGATCHVAGGASPGPSSDWSVDSRGGGTAPEGENAPWCRRTERHARKARVRV